MAEVWLVGFALRYARAKGEAMKTITARSAWSWFREYWLNLRRIRFWLAVVVILYTLVGFLTLVKYCESFAWSPWASLSRLPQRPWVLAAKLLVPSCLS